MPNNSSGETCLVGSDPGIDLFFAFIQIRIIESKHAFNPWRNQEGVNIPPD
jgi:hypothetical protein